MRTKLLKNVTVSIWQETFLTAKQSGLTSFSVLGIQVRMFLGLPDPDPLVRGTDPDPDPSLSFSQKGVGQTEIILAK